MDLNEMLQHAKEHLPLVPEENHVRETVARCKEHYFLLEQNHLMTYLEFLWTQFLYTRKRWWALQTALLLLALQIIPTMEDHFCQVRSTGVIGCLFVVLIIPELWRNRESDSTQVEATCMYSLRQIYAARITLFGIADVALLTVFSLGLGRMGFTFLEVLSQFLLPATVTACICFSLLCGKTNIAESVSLTACLVWAGVWWLILMNERIYETIAPAVWILLFGIALAFLVLAVRKVVRTTNQYWEVDDYGITAG